MTEFDPEFVDEVFGEGKFLDTITKEFSSSEEAGQSAAKEYFRNNPEYENLVREKFGNFEEFTKNEAGDIIGGDKNITELGKNFSEGNIRDVLKDMGFDMSDPAVDDYVTERNTQEEQTGIKQAAEEFKNITEKGKTIDKPEPTSNEELKKTISNADQISEDLKNAAKEGPSKLMEKLKEWKSGLLTILKVVGGIIVLAGIILAATDLYDMIKRLQHAMSGCFSCIGDKCCKIVPLTCDDNDIQDTDNSVPVCQACVDFDCKTGGDWLPIKKSDACACSANLANIFSGYDYNKSTGYNNCGATNPNCPLKNTVVPENYTATDSACPGFSGCISRKEACANNQDDCSKWCSSDLITLRSGQTVECKQMNFWGAAAALLGNTIDDLFPSGLLGKIEKILLYICLGLVVIAVIYMLFRYIYGKVTKGGDKNEKSVDIQINPIVNKPVTAAFSRKNKRF